jgi:1,5-anhydro-D-fructose reductase (1,5-anhydro-D-mannitol-forming)
MTMKSISGVINWGIIGCGDVCEVKSGPAFNKIQDSKLVAVMRRDRSKAEDYTRRHGVPRFYTDAGELIQDPEINAIYIATPPSLHEAYTIEALKAGKPVYVEKPVALTAESCERMIEQSLKYDTKVSVAHYRRGLPLFKKVKSLVQQGAIGNVRLITIRILQPAENTLITRTHDNWRINPDVSGGGLFYDLSPHQLDILYWIFGEPKKVYGQSLNQSRQYDAPDMTTLDVVFDHDVYLNGIWAFNVTEKATDDSCEIIGDKGKIRFSFFRKSTIEVVTSAGTETLEPDYPVTIQQPMIESVVKFFKGEGTNPCSLQEALVVMRMMDKSK